MNDAMHARTSPLPFDIMKKVAPYAVAVALGSVLSLSRAQTIRYVDDSAPLGGDGLAWATAFKRLHDALVAAPTNTTFRIAGGVYRPDQGTGVIPQDRNASLKPPAHCLFEGGYRGLQGGGSPDDRDTVLFPTVISGDLLGNDPSYGDNSYHLFELASTSGVPTRFDGMTWHGGRAIGGGLDAVGGGIRFSDGDLFLTNMIVEECVAAFGGGISSILGTTTLSDVQFRSCGSGQGSAIRLQATIATIDDCTFHDTSGTNGSIYCIGAIADVRDSSFQGGTSGDAGVLGAYLASVVTIEDCDVSGIIPRAIYSRDSSSLTIRRTDFRDGQVFGEGGALNIQSGTIVLEDCVFEANRARNGGAVYISQVDSATITGCTFRGNCASGSGGALWIVQTSFPDVTLQSCTFVANDSHNTGAVLFQAGGLISRCAFADNKGLITESALRLDPGTGQHARMDHCSIAGGSPVGSPSVLMSSSTGTAVVENSIVRNDETSLVDAIVVSQSSLSVNYSNVSTIAPTWSGVGNIDADPAFWALSGNDLHLKAGSPCIDAGDPAAPLDPDATRSDMGAFAFDPAYVPAPYTYCTAGTSTNGCTPTISFTGMPSISAGSGFILGANATEGAKSGLFFYGVTGPKASNWGASSSFLCIDAPTQRTTVLDSGGNNGACDGMFALDWTAYIASHPGSIGTPFSAGDSVWVQCWYRDPPSPKTTHLSNGLAFFMTP